MRAISIRLRNFLRAKLKAKKLRVREKLKDVKRRVRAAPKKATHRLRTKVKKAVIDWVTVKIPAAELRKITDKLGIEYVNKAQAVGAINEASLDAK